MRFPFLALLLIALLLQPAAAQETPEPEGLDELLPFMQDRAAAQALLAQPLPPPGAARLELLLRQWSAAMFLEDRVRHVETARQLMEQGRADPRWPLWAGGYLNAEYFYGGSGAALAACEPLIADRGLPLGLRSWVALRQTYMALDGGERELGLNHWRRAQALVAELPKEAAARKAAAVPAFLDIDFLRTRGVVERAQGDWTASTASLREAVRLSVLLWEQKRQAPALEQQLARHLLEGSRGMLVYALVRQGRAGEALDVVQTQLALLRAGRWPEAQVSRWHYRHAHVLNALQQHEAALAAADEAEALLQRAGAAPNSHTRNQSQTERVRALMGLRRWAEADVAYQAQLAAIGADSLASTRARDTRLLALLAAQTGRLDEALNLAERGLRYRERLYGPQHPITQEMAGVRGFVRLKRGDASGARADFERLFGAVLDRPSGWLDLDQRGPRGFIHGLVFDAYLRWVLEQARGTQAVDPALADRALQLADRIKLGSTQRALADSSARLLARDPALRALVEAEQTARSRSQTAFGALPGLLAREDTLRKELTAPEFKELPPEQRKAKSEALKELRGDIATQQQTAQQARTALEAERERLAQAHPAYADLMTPALPPGAELARWLKPDEALLVVHALEPGALVWLIRPGQPTRLKGLPLGEAALAEQVGAWRRELDRSLQLDQPAPAPGSQGHALHQALLAPLADGLQGVRSLMVATSGALAGVPLAGLLREPPQAGKPPAWLIRDMAVTQLPSAASLQALRRQPTGPTPSQALLGYGDPQFQAAPAPAPAARPHLLAAAPTRAALRWDEQRGLRYGEIPALPDTRTELQAIAQALGANPQADLRLGAQATRSRVLAEDLRERRVLAFATHGLLPGELPGLSKPALALAAEPEGSPLLELDDVLTLRLRAHWVLLSACNTAGAQSGDEAMSGLVRGFFFAGARSVLATHWAVESASAAALSAQVFKEEAGAGGRAQALRRAQLALADGKLGGGAWQHPYFWAGQALFGDPSQ